MRRVNLDRPLWIAAHFGFRPIEAPSITEADIEITKDCDDELKHIKNKLVCNAPEKAAFLRQHLPKFPVDTPLALAWRRGKDYTLELVGYPAGVAEAKLVRTSLSILADDGHKDLVVEINSIGDKESIASYERELKNYIAKVAEIDAELKQLLKTDPFNIGKAAGEAAAKLREEMPPSISYLSAQSRNYLKEVLEYLEALGVEYRFVPDLLGQKNLCSETLFAIRGEEDSLLAGGFRYSRLSKRFGYKKELSLVGATVYGEKKNKDNKLYKDTPRAKFYLIHLGREARLKALPVIELLRSYHIPLYHLLGRDKLASQLQTPEAVRSPYHLIIGQKEAIEGTVTVRNVSSRVQDTVPVSLLPNFLKHLPF